MKRREVKKRKNISSRILILVLAVICLVFIFVFIGKSSVSTNASETEETYYTSITVEKGDTLSGIAKEYGLSVKELKKINDLKSDTIYAGEALIVSYKK